MEDQFSTMFLGQFTTDSNGTLGPVPVPESVATTAGHYNVLALLPQDNTFARGSLYILEPKTKVVLFDLDGTVTVRFPGKWHLVRIKLCVHQVPGCVISAVHGSGTLYRCIALASLSLC